MTLRYKIFQKIFDCYSWLCLIVNLIKVKNKENWVVDIDNTIADTWPTLNQKWNSEKERILSIKPIETMVDFIIFQQKTNNIIFLSARPYNLHRQTIKWLTINKLKANKFNLIFVSNPNQKIFFLKTILKLSKSNTTFIDDFTYGTENGTTLFYEEIISKVKKMKLNYLDYNFINFKKNELQTNN